MMFFGLVFFGHEVFQPRIILCTPSTGDEGDKGSFIVILKVKADISATLFLMKGWLKDAQGKHVVTHVKRCSNMSFATLVAFDLRVRLAAVKAARLRPNARTGWRWGKSVNSVCRHVQIEHGH